jgi:hypothetical protein
MDAPLKYASDNIPEAPPPPVGEDEEYFGDGAYANWNQPGGPYAAETVI